MKPNKIYVMGEKENEMDNDFLKALNKVRRYPEIGTRMKVPGIMGTGIPERWGTVVENNMKRRWTRLQFTGKQINPTTNKPYTYYECYFVK